MSPETNRRVGAWSPRPWHFALLALVVPALVVYVIYFQLCTPVLDFFLTRHDSPVVYQIVPGGQAEAAGLREGDVILTVDGLPFGDWYDPQLGKTYTLEVQRGGQWLSLVVPAVPVARVNFLPLASAVIVVLTFWTTGALLLWRRFHQQEVRLLFLLAQTFAIALLPPLVHHPPWPIPRWMVTMSVACFHLAAPLLIHYYLTFPVLLGTPHQRRQGLALLYGLALVAVVGGLSRTALGWRLSASYTTLEVVIAIAVLIYVYLRRATPDGRRRLRLVLFGNVLAAAPSILFYFMPRIRDASHWMPEWLTGLFLILAPLSYLYATARHNLFDIDRLLNRTLVYALLSMGILVLYLGPFLLIYRFLPDDLLAQIIVVAGLTLLVGLAFDWSRTQVQRLVDRLFYGGWYDYPGVVETISDALARSLEREQLAGVLTRQVPELMQLHPGQLWIGEPNQSPNQPITQSPNHPITQFPITFRGQVRGLWAVGRRRDGEDFSATDRRILETLARQAEVALGNVLLVEILRHQLDEIRATQRQLLRSREDERARLARDLHDGPIQSLVGLNLQLGLLLLAADEDASSPAEALLAMRSEVRQLLADLRQVCAALRPPMLDALGLGAALRALAEDWSSQCGVTVHFDLPPDATLRSLPGEVAVNLYRVVQEALANVTRHAAARRVTIRLAWEGSRLVLTVQDDGQGFVVPADFHSLTAQGHFGLVGMQERVDLIGGTWMVESTPGQGTTVRVVKNADFRTSTD
ncbi:MAG: histidine kinase [Chloroflexota bacterium]|nr:histidine kinase [Chloroflexota bacterium]